ncbi:SDR family NAD(P)-dependent oxidoreductase [Actinoplanes sp. L3-i22]|uniref:SDR family NAD(P)-dependent oxidoreductase n=1 Tax=Actinoplanes sp. L3-i22 TaxID=2836373 RepID=UPI001C76756B|nr:SDR family NAD(P)-dependent oxidoreductase [Actinoplanes sp. L3-i22]BCY09588.1 short-chain dehydrogenase/reductase [Actinoplanes sp. L3-i22]
MSDTWLITGATSGFGRLVAARALTRGAHVIAVGRRGDLLADLAEQAPDRVTPIVLDITTPAAQATISAAIEAAGGLDVLVNNAGYGLFGAIEQISDAEARTLFDTNVLGNLAVLRAALPALRASRGRIVQLSSMNGQLAWASSGVYSASKGAVELLSEALAEELAPTGVRVTLVEPGIFATEFGTTAHAVLPDEVYAPTVGKFLSDFAQLPPSAFGDAGQVADAILALVDLPEPPLRLAIGADAITAIRASLQARLAELDKWEIKI